MLKKANMALNCERLIRAFFGLRDDLHRLSLVDFVDLIRQNDVKQGPRSHRLKLKINRRPLKGPFVSPKEEKLSVSLS